MSFKVIFQDICDQFVEMVSAGIIPLYCIIIAFYTSCKHGTFWWQQARPNS